jgi:hypothetical protein
MKRKQRFRIMQTHTIDMLFYILIALCSIIMVTNIKDFGASWDEPMFYAYAATTPEMYAAGAQGIVFDGYDAFADLKYYGPAYLSIGEAPARGLTLIPALDVFDAWHILNYVTFAMGSICLFWICEKFTDKIPAMLAAVLYFTQPLLLGHGVMNPKDTPFSAFFLISIWMGIRMMDAMPAEDEKEPVPLSTIFAKHYPWKIVLMVVVFVIIADRIGNHFLTRAFISIVMDIISGPETASSAHQIRAASFSRNMNLVTSLFLCLGAGLLLISFLKKGPKFQRSIFWAGVSVGVTSSIRFLGPAAGALVVLTWCLLEKPRKILRPVMGYIGIAAVSMYVT